MPLDRLPCPAVPGDPDEPPTRTLVRKSKDAWYVTLAGVQHRLAKGEGNKEEAYEAFYRLMAMEGRTPPKQVTLGELCVRFREWSKGEHADLDRRVVSGAPPVADRLQGLHQAEGGRADAVPRLGVARVPQARAEHQAGGDHRREEPLLVGGRRTAGCRTTTRSGTWSVRR